MLKEGLRTMVFPEGAVTFNLKLNGRRRYSHTLYLLDGGSAMIESPRGSSLEQLRKVANRWRESINRHAREAAEAAKAAGHAPGPETSDVPARLRILGELIPLKTGVAGAPFRTAAQKDGAVVTSAEAPDEIKAALKTFYRARLEEEVVKRLAHFRPLVWRPWTAISYGSAKHCWGRCNARGHIRFSLTLLMLRPKEIDYIVAHELAHLRHLNHEPVFWAEVGRLMPDWFEQKTSIERTKLGAPWFMS